MSDTWQKKKPIQRLKKSPTVFLSIWSFFLQLQHSLTHHARNPYQIWSNFSKPPSVKHRKPRKKSPVTHQPATLNGPPVSANPKWFSSPILVPLLRTISCVCPSLPNCNGNKLRPIAGEFWIPLMVTRERARSVKFGEQIWAWFEWVWVWVLKPSPQ